MQLPDVLKIVKDSPYDLFKTATILGVVIGVVLYVEIIVLILCIVKIKKRIKYSNIKNDSNAVKPKKSLTSANISLPTNYFEEQERKKEAIAKEIITYANLNEGFFNIVLKKLIENMQQDKKELELKNKLNNDNPEFTSIIRKPCSEKKRWSL